MGKKKSDIWYHYTEILQNRAKWSALSMQDLYRSKCSKNEKQRSLLVKENEPVSSSKRLYSIEKRKYGYWLH